MMNPTRPLGVMRPVGGGDPIPLKKTELMVGRRPKCDIRLDFENISGKHCQLRYFNGVWHVRDLGSTNGTSVNGQKISSEHGLMPEDELGIASHYYRIDYDPAAPSSVIDANQLLEEEMSERQTTRHRSLMELAGLERGDDAFEFLPRQAPLPAKSSPRGSAEPTDLTLPGPQSRPASEEDEPAPRRVQDEATPEYSDDDFFNMIREDVDPGDRRR